MKLSPSQAVSVPLQRGRIRLPEGLADAIPWLKGDEALDVWLLVVKPGRYILLSNQDVDGSSPLKELAQRLADATAKEAGREPFDAESDEVAALATRLIPTTIRPKGPGWRLSLPRSSPLFADLDDGTKLTLLLSGGYLELWLREVYDRALSPPLIRLLRGGQSQT